MPVYQFFCNGRCDMPFEILMSFAELDDYDNG